eukprot:Sspe_Gene.89986::Locus_61621_Transcript_3_9_Confidence_0.125_Length_2178::g.89986::m.89986
MCLLYSSPMDSSQSSTRHIGTSVDTALSSVKSTDGVGAPGGLVPPPPGGVPGGDRDGDGGDCSPVPASPRYCIPCFLTWFARGNGYVLQLLHRGAIPPLPRSTPPPLPPTNEV